MCPRPQYADLTYMGGTEPCEPMRIIFGSVISSWHTSLNIKFGPSVLSSVCLPNYFARALRSKETVLHAVLKV